MQRRKFLSMLGLAPFAAAVPSLAKKTPRLFWEGTIVPRHLPLPLRLSSSNAIPIHPFDAYLLLRKKYPDLSERWWVHEVSSNGNKFKLDGLYYRQTTEIKASAEARKILA